VTPRGKKPFATIYTPNPTKGFEAAVARVAAAKMGDEAVFEGPVNVTIMMFFPWAKSLPKYRQKAIRDGLEACTKKPDEDNVGKAVKDAMNRVIYLDDSQIVRSTVIKDFSETPRVSVRVTELVVPTTLNQPDIEMVASDLLCQSPPADQGLEKQGEAAAKAVKLAAVPPHVIVSDQASQSADPSPKKTACGAADVATCPNHNKAGAPWCVSCLPPGLRDPKKRNKHIIVIGEEAE